MITPTAKTSALMYATAMAKALAEVPFTTISMDFIFALPNQNIKYILEIGLKTIEGQQMLTFNSPIYKLFTSYSPFLHKLAAR